MNRYSSISGHGIFSCHWRLTFYGLYDWRFPTSLYPYQIENIKRQIIDYQSLNLAEKKTNLDMCPKCGAIHPRLIRGGKSHSGKQMYRCKECDKRFTYDNGHLTWHSHQSYDKWSMFIKALWSTARCSQILRSSMSAHRRPSA